MPIPTIIDAIRTPIGSLGGILAHVRPDDLAAHVLKAIITRNKLDPALIEEVYLGCANQAGEDNRNVARMATLLAGFPVEVAAVTFNRLCASGLNAINQAARAIRVGEGDVFIAGGVESMSRAPYSIPKAEQAFAFGNLTAWDSALGWRYPNPTMQELYGTESMGETAENIAQMMPEITREQQDQLALGSQQKASAAQKAGRFKDEIAPVTVKGRKGDVVVSDDEYIRHDSSIETMQKLRPAFSKDGTVTAGNASGINDGAAALVLMTASEAAKRGLKPLARIAAFATAGVDPAVMGTGPIPATRKVLARAGWKVDDLDLIEANEAFAAQALAVNKDIGWDTDRVNVNGGAIAIGHPIGASGARVLVTLLHEMQKREAKKGLATLCIGGGMGVAMCVER